MKLRYIHPNIEDIEIGLPRWPNTGETEMKAITVAVLALAMTSTVAYAHKHKGWGCHKHPKKNLSYVTSEESAIGRIHCGNGSR